MRELEREIQKAILDYLHLKKIVAFKHRNVGIKKPNGSFIPLAVGEKGISDIIGLIPPNGRFLAIEVKRKGNYLTEEQKTFLERINANGGLGMVAYSLDSVMAVL